MGFGDQVLGLRGLKFSGLEVFFCVEFTVQGCQFCLRFRTQPFENLGSGSHLRSPNGYETSNPPKTLNPKP